MDLFHQGMDSLPHCDSQSPFGSPPNQQSFESLGQDNGFRYWWASKLSELLGYKNDSSFRKAMERAMTTMTTLGIPIYDNMVQVERTEGGRAFSDWKLSRFACYLTAMNGDPKKPEVAMAQAYFASWAEACRLSMETSDSVERVIVRAEVSDREKALSGAAFKAGVTDFGLFQNSGYRGMYNMNLRDLREYKGIPDGRSPLDFMNKVELAANLFRVTQTEEKIRNEKIRGQRSLEGAAESVGKKVRATMRELSGVSPEDLPIAEDVKDVQKRLKTSHREIKKIDKRKGSTPS